MKDARKPSCCWPLAGTIVVVVVTHGCHKPDLVTPSTLESTLQEAVGEQQGPIHYFAAAADLDGDRVSEWIVHLAGPAVCGTGGCDTLILAQADGHLRPVTRISVSRPPIVIAETTTNGWRDLTVHVAGGGILPGYDALLEFDGITYPSNPTVKPAKAVSEKVPGKVVIPSFQSFTTGAKLR